MLALKTPHLPSLPFYPLPPNALAAAYDSLVKRGFVREAILDEFTFPGRDGKNIKINALAFAHKIQRNPADYAGFTLYNAGNGLDNEMLVRVLSQTTAPFHLIHRNDSFSFWASNTDDDHPRALPIHSDIPYHQLDAVLSNYAVDLKPERIADVKQGREQFVHPAFRDVNPLQLALWVFEATGPLLVEHFGGAVNELRRYDIDEKIVMAIATQLLGATILADTDVLGGDVRKVGRNMGLDRLIKIASERFPNYFETRLFSKHPSANEQAYKSLRQISYAGFVPSMLTNLYTAAYNKEERRKLGRYDTPLYLTHRIWETIPVEFLPPDQRVVADLTCGWGSFLIAGHKRLSQLSDMKEFPLREYLRGNDKNDFTARLAGLALLISTSSDKWNIDAEDALGWEWLNHNQPNIIVGNPPFRGSRKESLSGKQKRYQEADKFLEHAIKRLAPNGYLAMLMPRSFVAAESSPGLRKLLLETCDVFELWEMPVEIFPDAIARTVIVFAQKRAGSASLIHAPVRLRTVQKKTLTTFERTGFFTSSSIAKDQSVWDETSRKSEISKNTHIMDYQVILTEHVWQKILSQSVALRERATIFQGATVGQKPERKRWREYPFPKKVSWLTGAKTVLTRQYYIAYNRATTIVYPNELKEPLKNKRYPERDKEHLLAGPKVLLISNQHTSWGMRVKIAIERKGHYVSDSFWIIVPKPTPEMHHITHEVIAAIVSWKVSNAWIVEHLKHPKIPARVVRTIPFPRHLSKENCITLTKAVQVLEAAAIANQPAPEDAAQTIDTILKAAYQLDDETFERLRVVYEWDNNHQITLDPQPALEKATYVISGIVDQVNAEQGDITLWLDGFDELQTVPIVPAMPGWLLRPEAAFRTKIPYDCEEQRNLQNVTWGKFTPQNYTYLTDDELFAQLTSVFCPEGEEYGA